MNRLLSNFNMVVVFITVGCAKMSTQQVTFAFSAASYSVTEDEGIARATIGLTVTGMGTGSVSVVVNTADETAVAPSDYIPLQNQRIDFGSFDGNGGPSTSQTVDVSILDDTEAEGQECFSLTLSNPSLGVIGDTNSATICINDNDQPAVVITTQVTTATMATTTIPSMLSTAILPVDTANSSAATTAAGQTSPKPTSEASNTGLVVGVVVAVIIVVIVICIIVFFVMKKSRRNRESYSKAKTTERGDEEMAAK